ncbi:MAG: YhcH/YjgK/YiaL family protein [Bacteroidaceae bacterium]|nr:YhcH/YjgK/YiaL family protein [Bacteroidaceae bacterium]
MIIDRIENIGKYDCLCARFRQVADFLKSHDLSQMPNGHHVIDAGNLFVNIVEAQPKTRQEAKLETHNEMIDVQILLAGEEQHLYAPRETLSEAPYNKADDISFYEERPENAIELRPGLAVIYFPGDAHAPAICDKPIRKAIFKVRK